MGGVRKPLVLVDGRSVLRRQLEVLDPLFAEVVLCADDAAPFDALGRRVLLDEAPGQGPLPAIARALRAVMAPLLFVVAGDMPDISAPPIRLVVDRLLSRGEHACDAAVPLVGGFFEPLFACYARSCLPAIERALGAGRRKTTSFYDQVYVELVGEQELRRVDPGLSFLRNLNQPGDLAPP
jgi:molybdopterin-guanine dinucleotide biosynthesis protein A